MIRESIKHGNDIWNSAYGHGTFTKWVDGAVGIIAIVHFNGENFNRAIKSRELTEIKQ